jgi:hypothetical protein
MRNVANWAVRSWSARLAVWGSPGSAPDGPDRFVEDVLLEASIDDLQSTTYK